MTGTGDAGTSSMSTRPALFIVGEATPSVVRDEAGHGGDGSIGALMVDITMGVWKKQWR